MISFFQLAIIGTILFAKATGAPAAPKNTNCTGGSVEPLVCRVKLRLLAGKVDELNMNDKNKLKQFKDDCDSVKSCMANIKCTSQLEDEKNVAIKSLEQYCEAVVYVHSDFAKCRDKLDEKQSKCFNDWDPIPNGLHKDQDKKKIEIMKKANCKTYFGQDDCLKKEITGTCSQQEWNTFRVQFINYSGGVVNECDFSRLV